MKRHLLPVTGSRAARLGAGVLLFVLTLWVASGPVRYGADLYDEGLMANGGALAMRGRLPAVDYYAPYPPGAFGALGLTFRLWGPRLIVERWFAASLTAWIGFLGFWLISGFRTATGRTARPAWGAVAPAGVAAALLLASRWLTPVTGGALLLVLASGAALRTALPRGRPAGAFLCGAWIGAATLWRLDFGLYALIAGGGVWLLHAGTEAGGRAWRQRIGGALWLGLGVLTLSGPALAWIVARGGRRAVKSLFWWPLTSMAAARLPWTRHWAAFLVPLGALFLMSRASRELREERERGVIARWLLLLGLGFLAYSLGRTHATHLLPLRMVSLLLAAVCAGGGRPAPDNPRPACGTARPPALRLASVVFAAVVGASLLDPVHDLIHTRQMAAHRRAPLPGPRGAGVYPSARQVRDYTRILALLDREAPPRARLFCAAARHDMFLKDDNLAYFLSGRESGTYYWCLDAGVTSTLPVQAEMVRELEAKRVEMLLVRTGCANHEPNAGSRSSGVHLLDEYLHSHYRLVTGWDDYQICRRRPSGGKWRVAHTGQGTRGKV